MYFPIANGPAPSNSTPCQRLPFLNANNINPFASNLAFLLHYIEAHIPFTSPFYSTNPTQPLQHPARPRCGYSLVHGMPKSQLQFPSPIRPTSPVTYSPCPICCGCLYPFFTCPHSPLQCNSSSVSNPTNSALVCPGLPRLRLEQSSPF